MLIVIPWSPVHAFIHVHPRVEAGPAFSQPHDIFARIVEALCRFCLAEFSSMGGGLPLHTCIHTYSDLYIHMQVHNICTPHLYLYIRLVMKTISEVSPDRKCFRSVGGVLVERTVKDVIPAVKTNMDGVSLHRLERGQYVHVCMYHTDTVYEVRFERLNYVCVDG